MSFANALQKAVDKVVKVKGMGVDITFRRVTPGTYDTSTGVVMDSTVDTTVKGVFQKITDQEVSDLIQSNDRRCMVSAASLTNTPTTRDRVIYDSVVYQVIRVETASQAGIDLTYDLILRA